MANDYIKGAFAFALTAEQRVAASIAVDLIPDVLESDDYSPSLEQPAIDALVDTAVANHQQSAKTYTQADYKHASEIAGRYLLLHPDAMGLESLGFDFLLVDDGIHICHDESIDVESAIAFTQAVLATFDLESQVRFEWAETCSAPRAEAFGGGAAIITKDGAEWMNTVTWLNRRSALSREESCDRLFMVQGRRYGDDDDTVVLITAGSDGEARDIFLTEYLDFSEEDLSVPAGGEGGEPRYFIIRCEDVSNQAKAFAGVAA